MIYFQRKEVNNDQMVLCKRSPDLYEWIVAEWYDGDEKEYKYETDFGTPSANWDEYVKRNNITKWCYIKDIKD